MSLSQWLCYIFCSYTMETMLPYSYHSSKSYSKCQICSFYTPWSCLCVGKVEKRRKKCHRREIQKFLTHCFFNGRLDVASRKKKLACFIALASGEVCVVVLSLLTRLLDQEVNIHISTLLLGRSLLASLLWLRQTSGEFCILFLSFLTPLLI